MTHEIVLSHPVLRALSGMRKRDANQLGEREEGGTVATATSHHQERPGTAVVILCD